MKSNNLNWGGRCAWPVVLSLLLFGLSRGISAGQMVDRPDWSASNCGVNVIAGSLLLLKPESSSETKAIVQQILSERGSLAALTLAEVGGVLEKAQLDVMAVTEATAFEMSELLSKQRVGVLHLARGDKPGHFILAMRSNDSISIFDYPYAPKHITVPEFVAKYASRFSGNALLVSSRADSPRVTNRNDVGRLLSPDGPAKNAQSERTAVPASNIPNITPVIDESNPAIRYSSRIFVSEDVETVNTLVADAMIENRGEQILNIGTAKGSCSCFLGAQFDKIALEPGAKSLAKLRFAKAQFDERYGATVLIPVKVGNAKDVLIQVTVLPRAQKQGEELMVWPSLVYFDDRGEDDDSREITILMPSNSSRRIADFKYDERSISVTMTATGNRYIQERMLQSFRVLIKRRRGVSTFEQIVRAIDDQGKTVFSISVGPVHSLL